MYKGTSVRELNCSTDTVGGKLKNELCKGRYGLIKFYSPSCPHCIDMHSSMTILASELRKYNFDVFAVDMSNPANRPIQQHIGPVPYIPYFCMYDPTGSIFSIESELGSREISNLVAVICKITSGESNLSKIRMMKNPKIPKNCSLTCTYSNNKISCDAVGPCYTDKSSTPSEPDRKMKSTKISKSIKSKKK